MAPRRAWICGRRICKKNAVDYVILGSHELNGLQEWCWAALKVVYLMIIKRLFVYFSVQYLTPKNLSRNFFDIYI
jgi:hypothetical protein